VLEHLGGKVVHDGTGLDMEVLQHDAGLPASDVLDDVFIDLCPHEGHVTTSTQGAG
jgi:hypothetical protein